MNTPDPALRKLQQQITMLDRDVAAISKLVQQPGSRDDLGHAVQDVRWNCRKCNSLLAWYDPESDLLRIRYKDHMVFARVGGASPARLAEVVEDACTSFAVTDEAAVDAVAQAVAGAIVPGFVQVICRGCGEVNTQHYASEEEISLQPGG